MQARDILEMTKSLGGTYDNPFSRQDGEYVLRNGKSGKWFGIYLRLPVWFCGGERSEMGLNLKCLPEISALLREEYAGILPAYHMNKEHWITVRLDGSVPDEMIVDLMRSAYDIVDSKR